MDYGEIKGNGTFTNEQTILSYTRDSIIKDDISLESDFILQNGKTLKINSKKTLTNIHSIIDLNTDGGITNGGSIDNVYGFILSNSDIGNINGNKQNIVNKDV